VTEADVHVFKKTVKNLAPTYTLREVLIGGITPFDHEKARADAVRRTFLIAENVRQEEGITNHVLRVRAGRLRALVCADLLSPKTHTHTHTRSQSLGLGLSRTTHTHTHTHTLLELRLRVRPTP